MNVPGKHPSIKGTVKGCEMFVRNVTGYFYGKGQ